MTDAPNSGGIQDLIKTMASVWQAFAVPAFGGAWVAYQYIMRRKASRKRLEEESEETRNDINLKERAQLSDDSRRTIARQSREIDAKDEELRELRLQWIEATLAANNARTIINAYEERSKLPITQWGPWSWDTPKTSSKV
jgi:hypothetical protein